MAETAVVDTPAAPPAAPETPAVAAPATPPAAPAPQTPAEGQPAAPAPTTEPRTPEGTPPQAPEKYELTRPENSLLDPAQVAAMTTTAQALGLNKEQAQAFLVAQSAEVSRLASEYEAAAKADPLIGGAKFDDTVKHARTGLLEAMKRAGNTPEEQAEIHALFNGTALGNHKAFLRLTAWIGRQFAEDQPAGSPNTSGGKVDLLPTEDVLFPSSAKKSA